MCSGTTMAAGAIFFPATRCSASARSTSTTCGVFGQCLDQDRCDRTVVLVHDREEQRPGVGSGERLGEDGDHHERDQHEEEQRGAIAGDQAQILPRDREQAPHIGSSPDRARLAAHEIEQLREAAVAQQARELCAVVLGQADVLHDHVGRDPAAVALPHLVVDTVVVRGRDDLGPHDHGGAVGLGRRGSRGGDCGTAGASGGRRGPSPDRTDRGTPPAAPAAARRARLRSRAVPWLACRGCPARRHARKRASRRVCRWLARSRAPHRGSS